MNRPTIGADVEPKRNDPFDPTDPFQSVHSQFVVTAEIDGNQYAMFQRPLPGLQLRSHELAIGWIHIGVSVFILSLVGIMWWAASGLAAMMRGSWIPQLVGMFGKPFALALIFIALVDLVAAVGLLRGQTWARPLLIGVSVLELPIFPFGTAVGAYTLWIFLK